MADGPLDLYGSVIYLVPVTRSTEEWWVRLGTPRLALRGPQDDPSLAYIDRTTSDAVGHFRFEGVRPGDYYIYCRVLWTYPLLDSIGFGGSVWIDTATVAAGDTARVNLRPPRASPQPPPGDRSVDPDSPKFGEYVYVEVLPEALRKVPPEYPPRARSMGVDGTVLVQALVGRDGLVKDTRVVKSIPLLDQAAQNAVLQWVFKPAMSRGKPVAVWVAIPVRFTLN